MARAFFTDPAFMRKAAGGREKEIWGCIGCLVCRESMVGAGLTGLEAAEMQLRGGSDVTIVEMLPELGQGMFEPVLREVKAGLLKYSPKLYMGWRLAGIEKSGVKLERVGTGETVHLAADAVVLALGSLPDSVQAAPLSREVRNTLLIGDANKAGKIYDAIKTGFCTAFSFDPL